MKQKITIISLLIIAFLSNCVFAQEKAETETIKQEPKVGLNIGDKAPDLVFNNPDGKELALSELKGKVVLIDFWASWCGPCRMENPNVVTAYNKYSKAKFKTAKGFEIFGVSLDQQKDKWVAAIKKDNLYWNWHVSDLRAWQSEAAKTYNVYSIPTNFLIDENGIILAKSLRGAQLHYELDKLVDGFKKD